MLLKSCQRSEKVSTQILRTIYCKSYFLDICLSKQFAVDRSLMDKLLGIKETATLVVGD